MGNTFTHHQRRVATGATANITLFQIRSDAATKFIWITEIMVQDHSITVTDGPIDFGVLVSDGDGTSTDRTALIKPYDRTASAAATIASIRDTFTVEPAYSGITVSFPLIASHGGNYTWKGGFPVVNERVALRMLAATTNATVSYRVTWKEGLIP